MCEGIYYNTPRVSALSIRFIKKYEYLIEGQRNKRTYHLVVSKKPNIEFPITAAVAGALIKVGVGFKIIKLQADDSSGALPKGDMI